MRKVTLRCHCEIAGVEHAPGDVVEVDEDNFSRMLRKRMIEEPKAAAKPKKKKKAEASDG